VSLDVADPAYLSRFPCWQVLNVAAYCALSGVSSGVKTTIVGWAHVALLGAREQETSSPTLTLPSQSSVRPAPALEGHLAQVLVDTLLEAECRVFVMLVEGNCIATFFVWPVTTEPKPLNNLPHS
jgi:hypothetical protein